MADRCLELLNLPTITTSTLASGSSSISDDHEERQQVLVTKPSLLLDIGCGSGLSGEILTEEGHHWVGMDISGSMLGQSVWYNLLPPHHFFWWSLLKSDWFLFYLFFTSFFFLEIALDREVEGDLCLHDIGQGFGFRAGSFDGAIRLILKYPIQTRIPKKKKKVEAR